MSRSSADQAAHSHFIRRLCGLLSLNPQPLPFLPFQPSGISEEVFRQLETVQNRYDSSTAAAFRAVQKSGEMVVRTLDPRQFIRLASEAAPKINIDTNVSSDCSSKAPPFSARSTN